MIEPKQPRSSEEVRAERGTVAIIFLALCVVSIIGGASDFFVGIFTGGFAAMWFFNK